MKPWQLLLNSLMLFCIASVFTQSAIAADEISKIRDLRKVAQAAKDAKVLVVLFGSESCEYCAAIRKRYLLPLQQTSKYKEKIIVGEILKEDYFLMNDFNGNEIAGDTLALRYDVDLVPTIVFLDHQGKVLTKSIVGITLIDYLDMYIEQALNTSLKQLN